ncbi:MAG TPA: hypothetical protein VHU22_06620 [Xanthobacteraceae bacterium]|nr:hypothetical protein [Xanthobacteraceae bacterium]
MTISADISADLTAANRMPMGGCSLHSVLLVSPRPSFLSFFHRPSPTLLRASRVRIRMMSMPTKMQVVLGVTTSEIESRFASAVVVLALCMFGQIFLMDRASAEDLFPRICLDREVTVLTLIDDHAMVEDIASDTLSGAFSDLLDARALCYHGKTADGVSAYETIARRLGPLRIGRKQ